MRHLHFTQSLEPLQGGGLGRAALDLHLQLLADGSISRLLATRSPQFGQNWRETYQFERAGPERAYFAWRLRREAGNLLAQTDVVHGHGFYVYPNWAIGAQARDSGKPLVYHPQGMFEPWILRRSRLKKQLVHSLFENRNMQRCRLWRALTSKEADQIRQQGFDAPIVVAPNGIRLEDFDGEPEPVQASAGILPAGSRDGRKLVFMARVHPKKGLDLLLPAWSKLGGQRRGWELLIAGPDEGGYRAVVEQMISELDLASSVSLLGPVTGRAKLQLLRSANLFILPSHSEGMPVAVLEALACRCPVVATHQSNISELASEGGGWLCDATVDSVRTTLEGALACADSELASRGFAARALVERRYNWRGIAATLRAGCEQHCA